MQPKFLSQRAWVLALVMVMGYSVYAQESVEQHPVTSNPLVWAMLKGIGAYKQQTDSTQPHRCIAV